MQIDQIHPFMEKGQWWATKKPLVLYRVISPGSGIVLFQTWHPVDGITDASYVEPLADNWVYLWFGGVISTDYFLDQPLRQGDAFWNLVRRQVFLLGPIDRSKGLVTILSDEEIIIDPSNKFQRLTQGPLDPAEEPKSIYDRILEE